MAFTEFCCRSGGNNLNAGTLDGTNEPSTTPTDTFTGGDWDATTNVFTAAVGGDVSGVQVGEFASVYVDGDTVPTLNQWLVGQVTNVNAGTRAITVSGTVRQNYGTEVTTGTGTRSCRVGGAWAGPSGSSSFPVSMLSTTGLVVSFNDLRVNYKNDQTYSISTGIATAGHQISHEGYTTSFGDGGRATIDGSTNAIVLWAINHCIPRFANFILQNNGTTGTNAGLTVGNIASTIYRVVVNTVRGHGISSVGNNVFIECEAYACNGSNTANSGGFYIQQGTVVRCISHDNTGSNNCGFILSGNPSPLINCIADSNGLDGARVTSGGPYPILNCDFYNNGGSGVNANVTSNCSMQIQNSNFIKNGAYGFAEQANHERDSLLLNNGFGAGTQANTSGATSISQATVVGSVTYADDVTPWTDPANGDFRISLAAAKNAGIGAYTQTAASYAGTVGYPDIGAAQHQETPAPPVTAAEEGEVAQVGAHFQHRVTFVGY